VPLTVDFAGGAIEYFHLAAPTLAFAFNGLLAASFLLVSIGYRTLLVSPLSLVLSVSMAQSQC
jgi:hypothetical protein